MDKILHTVDKIKQKLIDVKSSTYIDLGLRNNETNSNLEVGDHVRISKHNNIYAKVTLDIGLNKFL